MSTNTKPEAAVPRKKFPPDVYKNKPCIRDLTLIYSNAVKMMVPKLPPMQQESIYNHLPKPVVEIEKPQRYVSKFRQAAIEESKANKMPMRTMGPIKVEVGYVKLPRKPTDNPKTLEKVPRVCLPKKPPIPLQAERTPTKPRPKRDFLKMRDSLTTVKPEPAFVDIKGHREILKTSGFVPVYAAKKDYGKIPAYLLKRYKENLLRAEEEYAKLKEMIDNQAKKKMPEAERQSILKGLRKSWKKANTDYQLLPLVLANHSMLARKERLEKEMAHLELDIAMFNDQSIYLPHDDE